MIWQMRQHAGMKHKKHFLTAQKSFICMEKFGIKLSQTKPPKPQCLTCTKTQTGHRVPLQGILNVVETLTIPRKIDKKPVYIDQRPTQNTS